MTKTNPVTDIAYEKEAEYIQSLIDSQIEIETELYHVSERAKKIHAAMEEAAGQPTNLRGKITITGVKERVIVTRKVNAQYTKEKGQAHPLRQLLPSFPDLKGMIRVEYKESGKKIDSLMTRLSSNNLGLDDNTEMAEALNKVRTVTSGKSTITIQDNPAFAEGQTEDIGHVANDSPATEF